MTRIRLTIIEPDDERHELVIITTPEGVRIYRDDQAPIEADTSTAVAIGNQHCQVCLADIEADCETERQTIELRVELDGD